jgi:hypothetical protein
MPMYFGGIAISVPEKYIDMPMYFGGMIYRGIFNNRRQNGGIFNSSVRCSESFQ